MTPDNDAATVVYAGNPNGSQIIRVFYGFNIANDAYNALYKQASYAGVSGDNTFEKALSNRAFPFYHSSNFPMKKPSLVALIKIVEQLDLSAFRVKRRPRGDLTAGLA